MAITVIDAMNGMGQDWECAEVLRGEVHRLIDAREERASQYRREWDGLRALLATAEQRIEELTDLLREAHGYLNIGLGIYDDITDAIGGDSGDWDGAMERREKGAGSGLEKDRRPVQ